MHTFTFHIATVLLLVTFSQVVPAQSSYARNSGAEAFANEGPAFHDRQAVSLTAEYFLSVNLSNQALLEPASSFMLAPGQLAHLVEVNVEEGLRLKSITVDYSTDGMDWQLQQSHLICYPDPKTVNRVVCLLETNEEQNQFLASNKTVYIRLSFFNSRGFYCAEIIQKGTLVQEASSRRCYRLEKGMQLWRGHQQSQPALASTTGR